MPRKARIDAPGALHHIICRGIERRKNFLNDIDRDDFVDRLSSIVCGSFQPSVSALWAFVSKGDERILGDSEFVMQLLASAEERMEERYRLSAEGYTFERMIEQLSDHLAFP